MKERFSVTYDVYTAESAADGAAAESGWLLESCTLRDAVSAMEGAACIEADCWPLSLECPPRWFTGYDADFNRLLRAGEHENRHMHLPRNITPSSARRIARLLQI